MEIIKVTIRGVRPLLVHNGRTKDPLDPWAKKLSAAVKKKGKSDQDHADVARIEYEAGLYLDDKLGPILPVDNLQACLIEGARKRKMGKIFESLVEVVQPLDADGYKLDYEGPRTVEALWASTKFVLRKDAKIGQSSVMRTRPRFPTGWSCSFEIEVLDGGAEPQQIKQALDDAGSLIGIGDWTPKYGRFVLEKFDGKLVKQAA